MFKYTLRKLSKSNMWIADPADWSTAGAFKALQRAYNAARSLLPRGICLGLCPPLKVDGKIGPDVMRSVAELLGQGGTLIDSRSAQLWETRVAEGSRGYSKYYYWPTGEQQQDPVWFIDNLVQIIADIEAASGKRVSRDNVPSWLLLVSPAAWLYHGVRATRPEGGEV